MKYFIALAICLLLVVPAIAEETSGATYSSPNGAIPDGFIDFINEQECIDHTHQYDVPDRDDPMGVGVDIVVWQNDSKNVGVEVQEKYDIANEENSLFAVVQLNLWEMFSKKSTE